MLIAEHHHSCAWFLRPHGDPPSSCCSHCRSQSGRSLPEVLGAHWACQEESTCQLRLSHHAACVLYLRSEYQESSCSDMESVPVRCQDCLCTQRTGLLVSLCVALGVFLGWSHNSESENDSVRLSFLLLDLQAHLTPVDGKPHG